MKYYEAKTIFTCVREDETLISSALSKPELVVEYMKGAFDENPLQESLWVLFLNRKNFVMGRTMITLGTATSSLAHPREVFRAAILAGATGIILAHNHPSGDPAPSAADLNITRQLREASKIIDIDLLDHVIIGDKSMDPINKGFYSFREAGII